MWAIIELTQVYANPTSQVGGWYFLIMLMEEHLTSYPTCFMCYFQIFKVVPAMVPPVTFHPFPAFPS